MATMDIFTVSAFSHESLSGMVEKKCITSRAFWVRMGHCFEPDAGAHPQYLLFDRMTVGLTLIPTSADWRSGLDVGRRRFAMRVAQKTTRLAKGFHALRARNWTAFVLWFQTELNGWFSVNMAVALARHSCGHAELSPRSFTAWALCRHPAGR